METTPTAVEMNIINATIECIEKYGVQGTTNRKIAEMAGVNNAAINYYFRSKDALIRRCMQITLENAFDFKDFENLPGDTAHQRCSAIFNDLILGGLNYPGLTRSHFYELLAEGKYDSLAVEKLNKFVEDLARDMQTRGVDLDPQEIQLACIQITTTVLMTILAPGLFAAQFGIDMRDEKTRQGFVQRLVERLL